MTSAATLSRRRYNRGLRGCHLEPHRLTDDLFKRLEVSGCCPDLQLGVAATMELNDDIFAAIVDFKAGNRLSMAAVQTLRDAKD